MLNSRIRVLLIESSPLTLQALQKMLAPCAEIEVVGTASYARQGLTKALQLRPAVICVSTQLADALELVRDLMSQAPCPILVLHNAGEKSSHLLEAGAVDAWTKPTSHWSVNEILAAELIARIKRLANVPVISRHRPRETKPSSLDLTENIASAISSPLRTPPATPPQPTPPPKKSFFGFASSEDSISASKAPSPLDTSRLAANNSRESLRIVAVGASTGGPHALVSLFSSLPRDFPYPVLCVQHISKGFLKELVEWMDASCALKVKIASVGEVPNPGVVYFGEEDRHLELDSRGRLWFSSSPAVDGHRPSVTALFQSVARIRGKNAIAVLLTGMGSDGARGMQAVAEAGGITFAQEENSCVVFGMPREAIALGAAQHVLSPQEIGRKLIAIASQP